MSSGEKEEKIERDPVDDTKLVASIQMKKIYEQDFIKRIESPEYSEVKKEFEEAKSDPGLIKNEENFHRRVVPIMIKFYTHFRKTTEDPKIEKGVENYITVLQYYDSLLSPARCIVL